MPSFPLKSARSTFPFARYYPLYYMDVGDINKEKEKDLVEDESNDSIDFEEEEVMVNMVSITKTNKKNVLQYSDEETLVR